MKVYWLTQNLAEVPPDDNWLSPNERAVLDTLRFPKRRAEWRLGRWTAKRALAAYFHQAKSDLRAENIAKFNMHEAQVRFPWSAIEIRAAGDGAPEAFCDNKLLPTAISLSHRDAIGFCAISPNGSSVGCDVELIEPRSEEFVADYFTAEEQALVAHASAQDRDGRTTLIWSAKESALKVLRQGLRLDTRSVVVEIEADNTGETWAPLRVRSRVSTSALHGWWQKGQRYLHTVLASAKAEQLFALY